MGVGIEFYKNRPERDHIFVGAGGSVNEFITRQKTKLVVVSSATGNSGTIFLAGNTRNMYFHLFENESDDIGRTIKPEPIEVSEKVGVFIDIQQEQELIMIVKKGKVKDRIGVFMCKSPQAMVEKLTK